MGVMEHNTADMGLHFAIAAVALYFGFAGRRDGNDARGRRTESRLRTLTYGSLPTVEGRGTGVSLALTRR